MKTKRDFGHCKYFSLRIFVHVETPLPLEVAHSAFEYILKDYDLMCNVKHNVKIKRGSQRYKLFVSLP